MFFYAALFFECEVAFYSCFLLNRGMLAARSARLVAAVIIIAAV
jgi:hypothetical protein